MKKLLLLSTILFLKIVFVKAQINSPVYSQTGLRQSISFENHCATDEMTKELYKKHPDRKKKAESIDTAIYEVMKNTSSIRGSRGIVYTIPVVVHIIHNNGPENISNIQVLQGIQDLNEAFSNTGGFVDANGVDVEIQFCLAQRDPNNNATNGITRDVNALTNMTMETDDIQLKNINRWNPLHYLNIWLVKEITSQSMGAGVAGYAYFPSSHGQQEDGIVNEARWFGSTKDNSKVHVHEAGHYLGLHHTFNGGCVNNNCLLDGDQVCDTPPDNSTAVVACNGSVNTCTTDDNDVSANNPFRPIVNGGLGDQNDIFHDHMDYGDLPCHTLFTLGQKNRMRTALTIVRASLLQSQACNSPCTNPFTIGFTASATTITVGTNITFTNTSTGTITSYNWSINNVSFATTQNSNNTFNTVGTYWVVLTENNSDPNCKKQDSLKISVKCSAIATFTSIATSIAPGGSLTFTNTSTNATSYQWYIDGVAQVTTPNFTHTFPTAGGYMVYLVACNTNCCDTSNYQLIKVGLCTSKEANIWYYGSWAGLDFNAVTPLPLPNFQWLSNTTGYTEGTSCISDKNGQLLFYTEGRNVWNNNHQIMQNGSGLWGHPSTTQSALIVKQPGNKNIYYIFTLHFQGGEYIDPSDPSGIVQGAFSYSIVDMSLNGGLGGVTVKNQLIYNPSTEKQVAVRHANGTDIWVITHEWKTDKFRSYLLTCAGLDTVPVISQTGTIHDNTPSYDNGSRAIGQMSISPDGKKIACTAGGLYSYGFFEIFNLDIFSGKISNTIFSHHLPGWGGYGLAFSPNGNLLYVATQDTLIQYDLSSNNQSAINASSTIVGINNFSSQAYFGQLQLATNGEIYLSDFAKPSLSVIQNPNAIGSACAFIRFGLNLQYGFANFGLQNSLVDYFSPKKASKIQGDTTICNVTTYYIKNNCGVDGDSIVWMLHGTSTIVSTVDSAITIIPTQVGIDTLISIQYAACGVVLDTLLIHTKTGGVTINLGKDTVACIPIAIQLNAGAGYPTYLWSTNATTQSINVLTPGIYWVEITDTSGCQSRDTILVTQGNSGPLVNLGADKIVCPGKVIPLDAGAGYMNYTWYDNSNNQTNTAWLPGTYWVTVKDSCGTISSDSIKITLDYSGAISVGTDTALCDNETMILNAGSGFISYLWQDGNTNQTYTVTQSGTYSVQVVTADGCSYTDSIIVNKKMDCNPSVIIKDCEIGVPDAFSPNGDGVNDELRVLGNCIDKITFVVYDRWGEKVFETTSPTQGWDGMHKGKKMDNAVFAYYLKATTLKGTEINLKGNISLIK